MTRCRDGAVEGHFLAHRLCLPDGRDGVRWGGLAFPLHSGDRIEVTDGAMLPGECRPWSAAQSGWRVVADPGSPDAYVFVDGPASARDRVVAAMTAAGLQPARTGPNMSGTPGDWFIRVQAWNAAAGQLLGGLFGPAALPVAEESTRLRERLMQERFEQAVAERDALRRELADARERLRVAIADAEAGGAMLAELQTLIDTMEAAETQRELVEAVPDPGPPRPANTTSDRDVATVVQYLLPRIELVRRSLAFVCVEAPARRSAGCRTHHRACPRTRRTRRGSICRPGPEGRGPRHLRCAGRCRR